MNIMSEVLNPNSKNQIALSLRQEMEKNKIKLMKDPFDESKTSKNGPKKVVGTNNFYYLNGVPEIKKDRDVCYKSDSISEIYVDWNNTINQDNIKDINNILKKQYAFTIRTCLAPYTKASMKYPHYYTLVFDNLSNCEKHKEWFNKCFVTIQEQEAQEEQRKKEEKDFMLIRDFEQKLKKNE